MPFNPKARSTTPCFTWSAWLATLPKGELPAKTRTDALPPVRFSISFPSGCSTSTTKPCAGGTKVLNFSSCAGALAAKPSATAAARRRFENRAAAAAATNSARSMRIPSSSAADPPISDHSTGMTSSPRGTGGTAARRQPAVNRAVGHGTPNVGARGPTPTVSWASTG